MDIEGLFPKHAGCGEQPRLHEGGMMEPRLAAILVGRGGLEERRVGQVGQADQEGQEDLKT